MSRFDRRLKPEFVNRTGIMNNGVKSKDIRVVPNTVRQINTIRSSSPRPGTADCKIPATNGNKMLGKSFFMGDSANSNKPNIEVVEKGYHPENTIQRELSFSPDDIYSEIEKKNSIITQKLRQTRDQNMRILLRHEIRLNIIEGNVDMLQMVKCSEVREDQINTENKMQLNDMLHTVEELSKNDLKNEQIIEKIKLNVESINQNLSEYNRNNEDNNMSYKEQISHLNEANVNQKEKNREIYSELEKYKKSMNTLKDKNISLNIYLSTMKSIMKKIIESDELDKESILNELEEITVE